MKKQKGKTGMDEYVDIRNADGFLTGEKKLRSQVHMDGDIHGTSHIWLVRKKNGKEAEVLVQKRSGDKDSFPGCFDISSAGHVAAGDNYLDSAIREVKEELGLVVKPEELNFLFMHDAFYETYFYGKPFRNHELSAVYILWKDVDISCMKLQKEEVSMVKWMNYLELYQRIAEGDPAYCIYLSEYEKVKQFIEGVSGIS